MNALLDRRLRHEPVQYITGKAHFWTLELFVTPDVLIPRPETEHLVEAVLEFLNEAAPAQGNTWTGADLGVGSGAIALALLVEREDLHIYGVDCSPEALAVALHNAENYRLTGRLTLLEGSWGEPLLKAGLAGKLDFIVSNPPYIAPSEVPSLPDPVRCYEPSLALVSSGNGLDSYRDIVRDATLLLRPGGLLALEIAPHRAGQVQSIIRATGCFRDITAVPDYSGRPRVVRALREDNDKID